MPTVLHFIDVGQGNMTLIQLADGKVMLYDCNVTTANEKRVLGYLTKVLGPKRNIDIFVNSHRDADHMRGVKKVHGAHPIKRVWDSGVTGFTPDSDEYKAYMDLRRRVGCTAVKGRTRYDYGRSRIRVMNSKNDELPGDANAHSIVIKVEHRTKSMDRVLASAMLTGDTDGPVWKDSIYPAYGASDLSSSILLGSHHGSNSFFDVPSMSSWYTKHLQTIAPAMTVISVGANSHGHPKKAALQLYEKHSSGSRQGNKVLRTDQKGTMKLTLKDDGGWTLSPNQ